MWILHHSCRDTVACTFVVANNEVDTHVFWWLPLCGLVVAGWRTIGRAISYSATLFIRTRCVTSSNFRSRNWVRLCPPSCLLGSCTVCFARLASLPKCGLCAFEVCPLNLVLQASWYGAATEEPMLPPTVHFVQLACSFCLLSKCTAGGSWKRTAAICGHSCSVSTRRLT